MTNDKSRLHDNFRKFAEIDRNRLDLLARDPGKLQLAWFLRCKIKMLVVLDGGSFGTADFGLEEFLTAFDTAPAPGVQFDVTKAHFGTDAAADVQNFTFAAHDLTPYDVIWLFGVSSFGSIPDADIGALSTFMDSGGGVFATGDHEALGVRMCGKVPRVRSMRKWHWPNPGPNGEPVAPTGGDENRHDTVWDRGAGVIEFDDQSDDLPQKTKVKMYASPHPFLYAFQYRYPHPVLCGPDGVIDILPDHAHEGECYVPEDLTASFTFDGVTIEEYPIGSSGSRIAPEIIAWSDNQTGIIEKGSVDPKTFGAIGVLDGHRADVGRVLVDATWHHFFNINLRGEIGNPDPVQASGFYGSAAGLDALERIKTYYRNIGVWLARKSTHRCIALRSIWWARWHHRIDMDLKFRGTPLARIPHWELIRIGRIAKDVFGKFASQCQRLQIVLGFVHLELQREILWPIIPPGPLLPELDVEKLRERRADPVSQFTANASLDAVLGAMIYSVSEKFPDEKSFDEIERMYDPTELFTEAAKHGFAAGARATKDVMGNAADVLRNIERLQ